MHLVYVCFVWLWHVLHGYGMYCITDYGGGALQCTDVCAFVQGV